MTCSTLGRRKMKYVVLSGDDEYDYDNLGFKKTNGERDFFDVPEDVIV
jgi:hypothetical protein